MSNTTTFMILVVVAISALVTVSIALPVDDEMECPAHQMFESCGTACPEHCPAYNERGVLETQSPVCVRMCVPGCFCAEGYVQDLKRNGACVLKSACSPP